MKQKRLMTPDIKREKSLRFTPVFQKYFDEKPENLKDPKMIEMNSFEVINQSPSPPKISDDIMQLKAERLEVYRDLYDYEHLYDSKNSMRVRLLQTLEQSKEVFKVISEIQKQIDTEKELLALINTELKPADISQKSKRKYKSKVVIG